VNIVNVSQLDSRKLIIQGGAYGEHEIVAVSSAGGQTPVGGAHFGAQLAPGAGSKLTIRFKRHANQPTLSLPWN
jgi:hypothetical protein